MSLKGLPQSLRDAEAAAAVTKKQPGAWDDHEHAIFGRSVS